MSESFELLEVERFTVGTIGEVGHRLFLIQAEQAGQVVTLKVEKQQVAALAQYMTTVLEDLARPGHLPDDLELHLPAEPSWAIGPIGVNYENDLERVVMSCEELVLEEDEADLDAPAAVARFGLTREQVAAFVIRATSLVSAGRPACPLCGFPIDPNGHACPRTNGHTQPTL